jgi:hypothetical protein
MLIYLQVPVFCCQCSKFQSTPFVNVRSQCQCLPVNVEPVSSVWAGTLSMCEADCQCLSTLCQCRQQCVAKPSTLHQLHHLPEPDSASDPFYITTPSCGSAQCKFSYISLTVLWNDYERWIIRNWWIDNELVIIRNWWFGDCITTID